MELNREQIIKALECCTSETRGCWDCPRFPCALGCVALNMQDALSLIKELTKRIEILEAICKCNDRVGKDYIKLSKKFDRLTEENERLRAELEEQRVLNLSLLDMLPNAHNDIVADTVRKMQERLKELYTGENITDDMHVAIGVIKANIDDIAKEMLEGG